MRSSGLRQIPAIISDTNPVNTGKMYMFKYHDPMAVSQIYTFVWSKYRPAILKMMVSCAEGPQQYKLLSHEFRGINPREKGGYAFTLRIFQGKAISNIKASAPAQDLLTILRQSKTAVALAEVATYEFKLDKGFVLHVSKEENTPAVISSLALPVN